MHWWQGQCYAGGQCADICRWSAVTCANDECGVAKTPYKEAHCWSMQMHTVPPCADWECIIALTNARIAPMKKTAVYLCVLCLSLCAPFVCFAQKVGVLRGPSGIPCARLMESYPAAEYEVFPAANYLLPKLLKGEVDIGFLPPNVAAKAYNTSGGTVVALAVSGNTAVSLITKDKSIKSLSDLSGKTVYVAGQGATPDIIFRYVLHSSGLDVGEGVDKVSLSYSIPNAQLAPALLSGRIDCAVVPEPFTTVATAADAGVIKVFDLGEEFACLSGGQNPPTTLIVANTRFARQQPDVLHSFLTEYERAYQWTLANTDEAGAAVERASLGLTADIAAKAIPSCAFVFKRAMAAREQIEAALLVFLHFDEASVGKMLPDDGFYFD